MSPSPPEDSPPAPLGALDNATCVSAEIAQPSEHGDSECGADRLERIEAHWKFDARYGSGSASGVFTQFLDARRHRARADSLGKPLGCRCLQRTAQLHIQPSQHFFLQQNLGVKMPTVKEMKLPIEPFSGKEEYRRIEARFREWGLQLMDKLGAAQQLSGVNGLKSSR
uniref:AlNc14C234G9345 protein n=1 Tax=Albugo laibachii Nc14 TaxID=890382 RepID=F0WSK0_9STRA|nr:AlNc14C234G9345 [Albugo laibachii Nc14]|eukprot:CCA24326.1 AlNc14C234G9345 [Albugo laibachii Nc14]